MMHAWDKPAHHRESDQSQHASKVYCPFVMEVNVREVIIRNASESAECTLHLERNGNRKIKCTDQRPVARRAAASWRQSKRRVHQAAIVVGGELSLALPTALKTRVELVRLDLKRQSLSQKKKSTKYGPWVE